MKRRTAAVFAAISIATGCSADRPTTPDDALLAASAAGDTLVTNHRLAAVIPGLMNPALLPGRRVMMALQLPAESIPGSIVMRDMRSGALRFITPKPPRGEGVETMIPARSGSHAAYVWIEGGTAARELRTVDSAGSAMRSLMRVEPGANIRAYDWSPDQRFIIADVEDAAGLHRLVQLSTRDGAVTPIRSPDVHAPSSGLGRGAAYSPDGRSIAFDMQGDAGTSREIFLTPSAGGAQRQITSDGVPKYFVDWSDDGESVYYATWQNEMVQLWRQPVRNTGAGSAQLVRGDLWGVKHFLPRADGSIPYLVDDRRSIIYILTVDTATLQLLAPPRQVSTARNLNARPVWSPDGRKLAVAKRFGAAPSELLIIDVATGSQRTLPVPIENLAATDWPGDGSAVIMEGLLHGRKQRYSVAVSSGAVTELRQSTPLVVANNELTRGNPSAMNYSVLSPDGRYRAAVEYARSSARVIVSPVASEAPLVVYTNAMPYTLDIRPDLWLIGGRSVSWAPNGGTFIFRATDHLRGGSGGIDQIFIASVDGRISKLIEAKTIGGPRFSPDGRHISYKEATQSSGIQLWALENLPGMQVQR